MKRLYPLLTFLLASLILLLTYWNVLENLNQVFFGNYFDALKNYYTLLYHVKWDESFWHFQGMNYPHGEHVLFTDNQPILANGLKLMHKAGLPVLPNLHGIINLLVLLGIPISSWVSYLCLRELKVLPLIALSIAVCLAYFSPQIDRMNGHFGLSYAFIIPLFIYQGLLFLKKPYWWRSFLIAGLVVLFSLIHAYFLAFAMLLFTVLISTGLMYQKFRFRKAVPVFFIQVVLPFLLMQGLMWATDSVTDRPSHPWSPFLGNYPLQGVFLPIGTPLGNWLSHVLSVPSVNWEAVTYIGTFSSILFLACLVFLPVLGIKQWRNSHPFKNINAPLFFLLAISILALVVPLTFAWITNSSQGYQWLGPIRQFRSIARFGWITFFAINFFFFARLSTLNLNKKVKYIALSVGIILLIFDAVMQPVQPFVHPHKLPAMVHNSAQQLELEAALAEFDVIIPLPHFHIGSESFDYDRGGAEHFKNAMVVSYASGLPITSVMLSRSSLSQTLRSLQYSIPTFENPSVYKELKGKKVAILHTQGSNLTLLEEQVLKASNEIIYEDESYNVKAFAYNSFSYPIPKFDSIPPLKSYTFGNRDTLKSTKSIPAEGERTVESIFYDVNQQPNCFEAWVYLAQDTKPTEYFNIGFQDNEDNVYAKYDFSIRDHLILLDGNWGLVRYEFEQHLVPEKIIIRLNQNFLNPTPTYIQQIQIK